MTVESIFTFLSESLLNQTGLITSLWAQATCTLSHLADEDVIVSQEIREHVG